MVRRQQDARPPAHRARGCEWKNGKIGLLLDAAVDTGALRLGLTGLAIRLPPSAPKPENLEVGLDGIDMAFRGGPVTISGGLFKNEVRSRASGSSSTTAWS